MKITQEIVRELLHYDSSTGEFCWRSRGSKWFTPEFMGNDPYRRRKTSYTQPSQVRANRWNKRYAGKRAGSLNFEGYRHIHVLWKHHRASHLAWLYVYGVFPETGQIDHINRRVDDDRISNLRVVTNYENSRNKSISPLNTTGTSGVTWHKRQQKWNVRINDGKKRIHVGTFATRIAADMARHYAEIVNNYTNCSNPICE